MLYNTFYARYIEILFTTCIAMAAILFKNIFLTFLEFHHYDRLLRFIYINNNRLNSIFSII